MYFSGTNHPVGDVCWLEVSRQKGLLTSFSQPVFEPRANAGDGKDYILYTWSFRSNQKKTEKKNGAHQECKNSMLVISEKLELAVGRLFSAGWEAPVLLPESFWTMRVGCSSCLYPQPRRNVRDFHEKTLTCPGLMSCRICHYSDCWKGLNNLQHQYLASRSMDSWKSAETPPGFAFNKNQAQVAKQQVASWLVLAFCTR